MEWMVYNIILKYVFILCFSNGLTLLVINESASAYRGLSPDLPQGKPPAPNYMSATSSPLRKSCGYTFVSFYRCAMYYITYSVYV